MDSKNAVRLENVLRALLGNIKQSMILCTAGVTKQKDKSRQPSFLFRLILGYLVLALAFLGFELVGRLTNWNLFSKQDLRIPGLSIAASILQDIYVSWLEFRAKNIAPVVQSLCNICILIFIVQSLDRLLQLLGCLWIKIKDIKPRIEGGRHLGCSQPYYPMVLVQVPMCNEKEVYEQSISSVCQLDWPKNRLLIQVLDDSNDESIGLLIKGEVDKWSQRNVNIIYRHRSVRTGFKAGNLKSAMVCDYVRKYEFVAMFDADFQPKPDFLKQTIPHFKGNPELGLVQARWAFVNNRENLLTRLQNINMCYHFEVEQQVNGVFINFFGFNGTAGVWRIKALEESGGWLDRTTVEDMDIAVRAHLDGWKFIFLNDVKVPCELPGNFESYRKQQYRWHSGPIHLFRLCLPTIITSLIALWKKSNLLFLFFLLRKLILPLYTFTFLCLILPLTMFVPEAKVPTWVIFHVPVIMSFLNTLPNPKSIPLSLPYLLFESTMSVIKFEAIVSGLLHSGSSHEWVITKKSGCSSRQDRLHAEDNELKTLRKAHKGQANGKISDLNGLNKSKHQGPAHKPRTEMTKKIHSTELAVGFLLLTAASRSLLSGLGVHFYVLMFQGIAFLLVGLAQIGD